MRLNRVLAAAGIGSRRHCDELIAAGRVTLNGKVVADFSVQPGEDDHVKVDGHRVQLDRPLYVLLHKPAGFVSTREDPNARDTIFDLLPAKFPRLFHVGRLDAQSEGLLVLTNDGDFAQKLSHPRHKIDKEYEVTLDHPWDHAKSEKLLRGVYLEGERAQFARLHAIAPTRVRVVLRQGINRQIRRMFYAVGYEVERLVRVRVGSLHLGEMPRGTWRFLTGAEVKALGSVQVGAQNLERRRTSHPPARRQTDQDRQRRDQRPSPKQRPKRRPVGELKNKSRQRPAR